MEQILEIKETKQTSQTELRLPTLLNRVQSIFIDTTVILISMYFFSGILNYFDPTPGWLRVALFIGLWFVYEPFCMTLGGTIGQRIMKLRVIKQNARKLNINLSQAYLRFTVKLLLGWISFLTIHRNREKRAIHDLVSGSVMIQLNKAHNIQIERNNYYYHPS